MGRILIYLTMLAGMLAGCATVGAGSAATRTRDLWTQGEQFVRIEAAERGATPDAHPATVDPAWIRNVLATITVRPAPDEQVGPVFRDPELTVLAEHLAEGLREAKPGEEVTFAVIGHVPALWGLASEREVTTGRVFVANGNMNIIFGIVHRDVKENEDRRLLPFTPGSRRAPLPHTWELSFADHGTPAFKRGDWLTVPLGTAIAPPPVEAKPALPASPGASTPAPIPASGKATSAAPGKSVEERLIILNRLKEEHLITDEEYRTKRREILNEL